MIRSPLPQPLVLVPALHLLPVRPRLAVRVSVKVSHATAKELAMERGLAMVKLMDERKASARD